MSNDLAIFDPANMPAHIATFNEAESNIVSMGQVNSLTYKGKVWTVNKDGNKTPLMRRTDDGDEEPRPTIAVVILDYAKRRGRSYYEGAYVDGQSAMPVCWSVDSITPDPTSSKLQSTKCATCPLSVKGSQVRDDGTEGVACAQYRMVAVQPYKKWDFPPLRLRLAVTSDFDGRNAENEAKGYYAFSQYASLLKSRGVKHTAAVVTRLRFDNSKAYPKVLFSAVGWLDADELAIVGPLAKTEEVAELLNASFTPNGGDGVRTDATPPEDEDTTGPTPNTVAAKAAAKAASAKVAEPEPVPADVGDLVSEADADEGIDPEVQAAQLAADAAAKAAKDAAAKVAAANKQAQARKEAARAAPADDDAPISVAPAKATAKAAAAAAAAAAPPKASTQAAPKGTPSTVKPVSKEVGAIIDDWG